jgi:hypothetical protein
MEYLPEEKVAIVMWEEGKKPTYSTDIADNISCGYGKLDWNGFWEFPLPFSYWPQKMQELYWEDQE